jgi:HxlR-like helix-turn-helix
MLLRLRCPLLHPRRGSRQRELVRISCDTGTRFAVIQKRALFSGALTKKCLALFAFRRHDSRTTDTKTTDYRGGALFVWYYRRMEATDDTAVKSQKSAYPGITPDIAAEGITSALRTISGRWKMTILFHLFGRRQRRFSELERLIPNVTQKMLTQPFDKWGNATTCCSVPCFLRRPRGSNTRLRKSANRYAPPSTSYCSGSKHAAAIETRNLGSPQSE